MTSSTPDVIRLEAYRPSAFRIHAVDLRFDLGEEGVQVTSRLSVERNPEALERPADITLDGEGLELLSVALDGAPSSADRFTCTGTSLTLHGVPDRFEVETVVRINPAENTALEGLYRSGGLLCTQCEAEGFRRITWYLDRPDVMARFRTTLVADRARYPVLLSNGNLLATERLEGGRHSAIWEDPFPKPSYLFALVAGRLDCRRDSFTTAFGREVELRIYTEAGNIDKCAHAMASLKRAMAWDEARYGREYDLDLYMIVAVNDFNMGAMENKGLNIFNASSVLASPASATDQDFLRIEGIVAHEYFHNWTGNRVTCRDWFQLSLKEGLTVFRDQAFSAETGSRDVKRIEDVRLLRSRQFPEDAGPMAHPVRPDSYIEINNFYTATVYEKGAEVVRMQYNLLGPQAFRRGMDIYFERFDGRAVTTDDFVACMEAASGRDLGQFRRWYTQAGTPMIRASGRYDAAERVFELEVEQSCPPTPGQPEKAPLHIPLAVGLLDPSGREISPRLEGEDESPAGTRVLEVRGARELFRFVNVHRRPVPSLLRGFSAPVKLSYDYSDDELSFLMIHDTDGFNRWDAAQRLFERVLLRMVEQPGLEPPPVCLEAFRTLLESGSGDAALAAELLTLPSESDLGEQMARVDVDGIHAARERFRSAVASSLRATLLRRYEAGGVKEGYALTPEAIGRRRMRNLSLAYLAQPDDETAWSLCDRHYRSADNMTDAMAALFLIASGRSPDREALLAAFYDRWRQDPLVVDKWFAVQAASSRPDTLARVEALTRHPAYDPANPNKVRSLLRVFVVGNPVRFHAADGGGYRLLGDQVRRLDPVNPQLAAGLLRAIAGWRRHDPGRQALMRGEIERVLSSPGISRDLFEVASKILGEAR